MQNCSGQGENSLLRHFKVHEGCLDFELYKFDKASKGKFLAEGIFSLQISFGMQGVHYWCIMPLALMFCSESILQTVVIIDYYNHPMTFSVI